MTSDDMKMQELGWHDCRPKHAEKWIKTLNNAELSIEECYGTTHGIADVTFWMWNVASQDVKASGVCFSREQARSCAVEVSHAINERTRVEEPFRQTLLEARKKRDAG
jgi:hypothetical protein